MTVIKRTRGWMALLLVLVASKTFGQRPHMTPEARTERQIDWMQRNLMLTEEQNKRVHGVLLHYARQADENVRDNPKGPDRRMERQDIIKDRDAAIKAVLTGEQYTHYRQHEKEVAERMQQRRNSMQEGG
jgi:Spy/CpxP family protein refolding chaperone